MRIHHSSAAKIHETWTRSSNVRSSSDANLLGVGVFYLKSVLKTAVCYVSSKQHIAFVPNVHRL